MRVNNDELKTKEKCMAKCRESLAEGKSVVIDNTNPTADVRGRYTAIAQEAGVPVRCFVMTTDKQTCIYNNLQRKANTHRRHISKAVPTIAIHTFFKTFAKPVASEGFESIVQIKFVADSFQNSKDRECYEAGQQK